ncbi:MAG: DUF732 domain-containing protein [Mycobacterium sp.]
MRNLLVAALITMAMVGAPTGRADGIDDQFLSSVPGDPARLINFAHDLCATLGAQSPLPLFYDLMRSGLSAMQVSEIATAAATAYCPEKSILLPRLLNVGGPRGPSILGGAG